MHTQKKMIVSENGVRRFGAELSRAALCQLFDAELREHSYVAGRPTQKPRTSRPAPVRSVSGADYLTKAFQNRIKAISKLEARKAAIAVAPVSAREMLTAAGLVKKLG